MYMLILYKNALNLPVIEEVSQTKIGEIADFVLNEDCSILAVLLKSNFLEKYPARIISFADVLELNKRALFIHGDDSVLSIDELPRVATAIKSGRTGIGQKVTTTTGVNLGKVDNYLINSKLFVIAKLYVSGLFSERILPAKAVVKIDGRKIIVNDTSNKITASEKVAESLNLAS